MTHMVYVDGDRAPWLLEVAAFRRSSQPSDWGAGSVPLRANEGATFDRQFFPYGWVPIILSKDSSETAPLGPIGVGYEQPLRLSVTTLGLYAETEGGMFSLSWHKPVSPHTLFQTYHSRGTTALYVNGGWTEFVPNLSARHLSYLRIDMLEGPFELSIKFGQKIIFAPVSLIK